MKPSPVARGLARARCRGVASLEFALVFPLFLLVLYALIVYALIFAAQHTLVHAATEGARATLRAGPADQRGTLACTVAAASTGWIERSRGGRVLCEPDTQCTPAPCLRVALRYDYAQAPLVPTPPLLSALVPTRIESDAVVHYMP